MENHYNHYNKEMTGRMARQLSRAVPERQILTGEPMAAHTTFRVGGPADIFVEIHTESQLAGALAVLRSEGLARPGQDYYLIGNGSNLLVSDDGLCGVALHLGREFGHIEVLGNELVCEAGATLAVIAKTACENVLTGFEFAAGIPGTLGGAIVMNAGAYGGEIKQVIKSVRLLAPDGTVVEKSAEEMKFSYRHSILKEQELIALGATIALERGEESAVKARMDDLAARRREKQPLEYPSAGSTFKRPEGYFAAKLIEEAGLRGYRKGGAQVSEKHCGFVVNRDNASASDIYALILEIQRRVRETSGVIIEPEVIMLGRFEG